LDEGEKGFAPKNIVFLGAVDSKPAIYAAKEQTFLNNLFINLFELCPRKVARHKNMIELILDEMRSNK
jgi:hypothetical protein